MPLMMTLRLKHLRLLQTNLSVANEVLTLAHRLGLPQADDWAAAVMAQAQKSGAINGQQILQAARLAALGQQLESPAQTAVLSVQDIRQLAEEQAQKITRKPALKRKPKPKQPRPVGAGESSAPWAEAQSALRGTTLIRNNQPSAEAVDQLMAARKALAQEVGQPVEAIPRTLAALKVASEYWIARDSDEAGAFEKARAAQDALTQAMAPMRSQATQQRAVQQKTADYQAALASIQALEPGFDEAKLMATSVGEVTLSQLEAPMATAEFASLRLDIARQYLAHYQTRAHAQAQAQAGPDAAAASQSAQALIEGLKPALRKDWTMQLIGGPSLSDVVQAELQHGGKLTTERLARAVQAVQPEPLLPALPFAKGWGVVQANKFYEIRYESDVLLTQQLRFAMRNLSNQPMQIRTADGRRRLDVYRHGSELHGSTIIDQRDGSAVPQPYGIESAILTALGIHGRDYGGLVISYGSGNAVMENDAIIYPDPAKVMQQSKTERALSTQARLANIDADYTALLRRLDTASPHPSGRASLNAETVDVSAELAALKRRVLLLEMDEPRAAGKRIEMPEAAKLLSDYQSMGWFYEALESASGQRQSHAPLGQSVTELRLATIRELTQRTPDMPERMKCPLGEATLSVTALRDYAQLERKPTYVTDGTLTPAQYSQMLASPRKYFNFLLENPSAWQKVVGGALKFR
jgi:hypothetical protein